MDETLGQQLIREQHEADEKSGQTIRQNAAVDASKARNTLETAKAVTASLAVAAGVAAVAGELPSSSKHAATDNTPIEQPAPQVKVPESHVSNMISLPTHEEAVAILANARPNAAQVSPDGPMVEEFGPNQSETGPFPTKDGNFQLLHAGQPVQGLETAVAVEKQGDKIVTTEGP